MPRGRSALGDEKGGEFFVIKAGEKIVQENSSRKT